MSKAVIMMGLPGAGKTSYVKDYLHGYYHLSADNYHIDQDGKYHYKPERAREAHNAVKREFALWACGQGHPTRHIVVDNTNLAIEDIAFYIECATAFSHEVQVIYLYSIGAFQRQTHGVPLNAWQAMAERAKLTILSWPARWPKTTVIET